VVGVVAVVVEDPGVLEEEAVPLATSGNMAVVVVVAVVADPAVDSVPQVVDMVEVVEDTPMVVDTAVDMEAETVVAAMGTPAVRILGGSNITALRMFGPFFSSRITKKKSGLFVLPLA